MATTTLGISQYLFACRTPYAVSLCSSPDTRRRGRRIEKNMTTTQESVPYIPADFLTRQEVADILRIAKGTVSNWAHARKGPPFYRLADGVCVYSKAELAEWLAEQRIATRAA